MADLQDHVDTATAIGQLDAEYAQISAPARPSPVPHSDAPAPPDPLARARALLAAHPVVDGFNGLAHAVRSIPWCDLELGERSLDTDVPRLRVGRVGAQFWSLQVPADHAGDRAVSATLDRIDQVRALVAAYPEALRPAHGVGEMTDARNCGRVAALLGPVSGHALADSLGTLRAYHALGVRSITLTGTSWTGRGGGLTRFGQEVVREMNRLGILVDLTGASPDTMRRALAVAKAPVIFSHSAAHELTDHPSNVPDDVLRMLRSNNGLCMVGFAADQVAREGTASLREVADHLEHVREVAGPDCVGLGAGYDTGATHADGLTDVSRYPQLIAELLERDWSESDVAALTWGNAARVMREAEFASRAAQLRRAPSTATIGELDR
ncbi:dipeptidase [Streptomyces sp. NBC_00841]|uniref:dipeptidase n=1 Tax=Streptomyces sp. NBC_00841 TaxID=2975847 RepID=UPI002DD7B126|nr:dipeptidase [Streptomyces sp. NBC_00841]WRZ99964.1 dipeptidase [Streptomyces sp. NBC_00841]